MLSFVPELEGNLPVRRQQRLDGRALGEMLLAMHTAAGTYIRLARCFQGWEAASLQRLAREARAQASCLSGIYALVTGEVPDLKTPAPEVGPVGVALRKCYVRAMRILVACEAHSGDAEYGPVLARLAAQQQAHCATILEIIGTMGK